jgi:MraZ protein
MPNANYLKISGDMATMNALDPKVAALSQYLFGNGSKIEFDSAGRFVIPQFLRDFAGLQTAVMVIGNNTNITLWTPERWAEKQKLFDNAENVAALFSGLNLSF